MSVSITFFKTDSTVLITCCQEYCIEADQREFVSNFITILHIKFLFITYGDTFHFTNSHSAYRRPMMTPDRGKLHLLRL
jgi:hypothetical protein